MTNHRSPDAARASQDPQNTPTDPTPAPTPQPNPARHLYGLPIASGTLGDLIGRLNQLADRWDIQSDAGLDPASCQLFECARELRAVLADQPVPGSEVPLDIARVVVRAGTVTPSMTEPLTAAQHAEMQAENVRITAERYGQDDGPRPMYWLAVGDGSNAALALTGTSPNSAQIARGMAAAWNMLVRLSQQRLALDEDLGAATFKGQPCVVVQPANSDGWLMIRDHQGQVLEVHRDELNGGAL